MNTPVDIDKLKEQIARIIDPEAFLTLREIAAEKGLDAANPPPGVVLLDPLDGPPSRPPHPRRLAMEVGSERDLAKMVADHIRNADEPLDAITDATVAAIEAWKLNDEAAIDTAMRSALDRIAASAALVLTTSGLEQP